tara:strand:+ start:11920 stop:14700 length:2781 start_codon:yes stop_codon:yes gene_type:complete
MANEIKLKRGSGSDPSSSDLVVGEVALRTDSGQLFTKKDDGNISEIGASAGVSDGDKGDITVSNSGATFTIDNDVVSTAKMANMATQRILGRQASGTGDPQHLTATEARSILNVENGATADQTASEILTLIKTVDGGGSGLDADLLDGVGSGSFLRSDADDSFSGTIVANSDATNPIIKVQGSGPNFIQFTSDSSGTVDADSINFIYRTGPNTLAYERATDTTILFSVDADNGQANFPFNLDVGAGLDVTGNITVTGTVDGVDIAARNTLFGGLTSSSGVLTNGVTATTQGASDNTTKVATTAYVTTAVSNLINGAPAALDTLNELAAAMNDDAAFSTTVTNSLATKMPLAGGQFTGNVTFSGSQTVDGRDLSVDGTKLDGIEASATADQTASEILTLIKTVDGAGSGLDADTLDGISSASFLRSDANDTFTGDLTISGNVYFSDQFRIGDDVWLEDYNAANAFRVKGNQDSNKGFIAFGSQTKKLGCDGASAALTYDGHEVVTQNSNLNASNISSGTVPQARLSASTLLTLIKTVDGAGSGLDADTLDGFQTHSTNNNWGIIPSVRTDGVMEVGKYIDFHTADNDSGDDFTPRLTAVSDTELQIDGNKIWHAGNDGAGSGLDADTLDGISSASFLRSDVSDICTHRIQFKNCATNNQDTIATSTSSQGALEIYNLGAGNDAFMAFHTGGDFAFYFGIDADINDLAVGGWSMGANKYRVWHENNDGSGSGLDSDLLDGQEGSYYRNAANLTGTLPAIDGSNLTGVAAFASGTRMLFQQTSAPTGWTKDTSDTNNRALRVVSGSAGSGGSVAFTTAFASKSVSGSVANTSAGGSVGNHTLSTSQIPSHSHGMQQKNAGLGCGPNISQTGAVGTFGCNNNSTGISTFNTGGGGSHNHSFSGSAHNHSFSGTAINLAVQYLDVIIASKN